MTVRVDRRFVLAGLGLVGVSGCSPAQGSAPALVRPAFLRPSLVPLDTDPSRISRITVCTRPFRPAGPRIEAEAFGDKRLVHNYGHGGSGWSLSWGSGAMARDLALEGGARPVAVIGCGALGLTAALQILRAGAPVTIYAAERTPYTRSARATGVWSPQSRLSLIGSTDPGFPARWEAMSRASWAAHHSHLGLDGDPVRFIDHYSLHDEPERAPVGPAAEPVSLRFQHLRGWLADIGPDYRDLTPGEHPFRVAHASAGPEMTFNVAEYARQITEAFLMEGGRIVQRTFHVPSELSGLSEPVIVNCTGYGARALFGDDSLVPVRGQIGWLTPQPDVTYGLHYRSITMVPREDGIVVQASGSSERVGYGVEDETPDRAETEEALAVLGGLFSPA